MHLITENTIKRKMYVFRICIVAILFIAIFILLYFSREVYLLAGMVSIFIFSIIILILPFSIFTKTALLAGLFFIFKTNLNFMTKLLCIIYKAWKGEFLIGTDDRYIRSLATELFQSNFIFRHNFHKLPSYPTIIVANYVYDRLESICCAIIPVEMAIVMGKIMVSKMKLNHVMKHCIVKNKDGDQYETIKKQIENNLEKNISVFAYVSKGTLYGNGYVSRLRSGMFRIAQELGVPVTPIAIDFIYSNCGVIPPQNFSINVGDTFMVTDVEKDMYRTRIFFRDSLAYFRKHKFS